MHQPLARPQGQAPIPLPEFIGIAASLMALTALGIDSMLPALPAIGESLGVAAPNDRQFVITSFLVGFAITQLLHGPLSDRFGRRTVMIGALIAYVFANIAAAVSGSFAMLLAARFAGGAAVAGARVVTIAMVRDCYSGDAMARVMSLVFIFFMAAPVFAPSFGAAILAMGLSWRWVFGGVGVAACLSLLWFAARMPETLPPEARLPLRMRRLIEGYRIMLSDRTALGYAFAAAFLMGGLFGFISSIQQIVATTFGRGEILNIVFACIAGTMAVGSFLNSRIVMRFGARRISHTALLAMMAIAAMHLAVSLSGNESLWVFVGLQAAMMPCFGLALSNMSSIAMEDMGEIAGTASSLQGFISTFGGAVIGGVIGQSFTGTTVPLDLGFLLAGFAALGAILFAERGRLFGAIA